MADVVVDASVAVKWVLLEDRDELAKALYQENQAWAPPHMFIEATQGVRKRMLMKDSLVHLTLAEAEEAVERLVNDFSVKVIGPIPIYVRALQMAEDLNHTNVCDMHYAALAEVLGVDFWTDDRVLVRQAASLFPFVKWLGTYSPSPA